MSAALYRATVVVSWLVATSSVACSEPEPEPIAVVGAGDSGAGEDVGSEAGVDGDPGVGGDVSAADSSTDAAPQPCTFSSSCPGPGGICLDGQCHIAPACKSDKACGALGLVCDKSAGRCVMCLADLDCDEGLSCKANHCLPPATACKSSKNCAAGEVCDKGAGLCVECASGGDCGAGFRCWQTRCVALVCEPKAVGCKDKSTRRVCDEQGAAWLDHACGEGMACAAGKCVGTLCEPGKSRCSSGTGSARQVCSADGTAWQSVPCGPNESGAAQTCQGGSCVAQTCTPGDLTCAGDKVMKCAATGLSSAAIKDCAADGQVCFQGACQAKSCQTGASKCADAGKLATCKADGSGWQISACPTAEVCSGGACVAKACEPNSKTCIGNQVGVCDAAGAKLSPGADCDTLGQLCQAGACVAKPSSQQGFLVRGGFGSPPDIPSGGSGFRVLRQGWLVSRSCSGGICQQGGFRP